jgi:hypothetical protein
MRSGLFLSKRFIADAGFAATIQLTFLREFDLTLFRLDEF